MLKYLIGILFLLYQVGAWATPRWIDISWAEMDLASDYDVEVYIEKNDDSESEKERSLIISERTKDTEWRKQVKPGRYFFRIRGVDRRGVPGEWGDLNLLDVRLPRPVYVNPLPNDILKGLEEDQEDIALEWKPVDGANFYLVEIWSNSGFE